MRWYLASAYRLSLLVEQRMKLSAFGIVCWNGISLRRVESSHSTCRLVPLGLLDLAPIS